MPQILLKRLKLNAGKRVGNYNLAKCRDLTDRADSIIAQILALDSVWDDIDVLYAKAVRTGFDDE